MVSGFLMAKKSEQEIDREKVFDENIKSITRQIKSYFPFILVAALFSILFFQVGQFNINTIFSQLKDISIEIFGLQMYGYIGNFATGVTWYISSLLI